MPLGYGLGETAMKPPLEPAIYLPQLLRGCQPDLFGFSPDLSEDDVLAWLKAASFRQLGEGSFARAFLSPCGRRVLRLSIREDGGETAYAIFRALPDNPYVPRVYGWHEDDDYTLAEVEPLRGISSRCSDEQYVARCASAQRVQNVREYTRPVEDQHLVELFDRLNEAAETGDCIWDLHSGNIMFREDDQPVLTDPLIMCNSP